MEVSSQQVIPIFDGDKYDFWRIKMTTIFKTRKLWTVVEDGVPDQPTQREETPEVIQLKSQWEEAQIHDMMALQILQTAVTDQIFSRIAPAVTSKEAWEALKSEFQGTPQVRLIKLQSLRREYENLKMNEGDNIKVFTGKLIDLGNQLRVHGEEKTDYQIVQKILISLPARFDSIVAVMEQTKDLTSLPVTELIGTLQAHEHRVGSRLENNVEGALYARTRRGRSGFKPDNSKSGERQGKGRKWCGICKKENHTEAQCWKKQNRGDQHKNLTNKRECYNCGKIGHFSKDCRSRKYEKAQMSLEEEEDDSDHMLFSASEDSPKVIDDVWLVDSGCTNHMTKEVKHFTKLDRSINVPIKVGNGDVVMTAGKGDISIMTVKGRRVIKDVFLVPGLAKNLLSVPQIISRGYRVLFENKRCIIQDPRGKKVAEIQMVHKSFPIKWNTSQESAMINREKEAMELWHRRFGHVSNSRLQLMHSKEMVNGLPKFPVNKEVCGACKIGKQTRDAFPKESQTKTKEKLEIVHTDVCGPMQTDSLDGSRYFLLFVDDFTRMSWVYFLKQKSEVFLMFKKFKALVENQSGCKIKRLRSDGGGEYTSREFNKFCQECGIERQVTVPYSPQQNGVAERKNRSLMEMARTMITDQGLPYKFWAEAVYTSAYLQNRLPTKANEDVITPIEKWSGHKPTVGHLKIFGSLCFVHVPDEKRRKLEDKAKRGIFIGYSSQSKGYRVLILENEKVEISRDVSFDEGKKWDWDRQQEVKRKFVLSLNNNSLETEKSQGLSNLIHSQLGDQNPNEDEEEGSSQLPKKYKSMTEIMQIAPRVDLEEAAQANEACFLVSEEPQTYDEASEIKEWREAMEEEIKMIEKNGTWLLVDKPVKKNVIGVKWIYRIKTDANGNPTKYKARLVAKGFSQEYGVDYLETFAPVSRHDTIRAILALAAQMKWRLYQMDVKSAFLNGELEEEIYVAQPPGFISEGEEDKVLMLRKALYGLKQAPRAWYGRIDSYFLKNGFQRSMNDAAMYVMKKDKDLVVVSLYVDDIIITGNNSRLIEKFKDDMKLEFEMTDLGMLNYFLGMEIIQDDRGIFLSQEKYSCKLVEKFGMKDCKSVNTPLSPHGKNVEDDEEYGEPTKYRSIVGGLLYLCTSRPDIMFASSYLSRYMSAPLTKHYQEAKRVLRYIKGTSRFGVQFTSVENPELHGYSDSDWGGSNEDKKSTSGYLFTLGSAVFCWQSSKQKTVAQSTAEAEYIAVCAAANQAIWLQRLLGEIGFNTEDGVPIYCDNKSAIAIGKNPVQHRRTKHIEIKYHFVREAEHKGLIQLKYCQGEVQLADLLTKALSTTRFEELRRKLGVGEKLN